MKWKEFRFGEVVVINPQTILDKRKLYPFIPMEDIVSGQKHILKLRYKEYDGSGMKFENGDTIFARITPCLEHGKIIQAKNLNGGKGFGSTEYFIFRRIENISDPDFVYYLSSSDLIKYPAIKSMVGASGRQRAQKDVIAELNIMLPPLPIQKKIASILSAYDDLIENNLRRIELLEKVARELYKEWFIYFRFPGYKKVKFKNGLPEGWEQKKLSDAIILNYGKALKAVDRINGKFPVYGSSGIVGWHDKHLVNGPGIIIGRKGNVGTVFWENQNYNPIDTVYYVCSEQSSLYLYYSLLSTNFQNNDGAVPGLNRDYAYSRNILKPAQEIIHQFHNIVIPLHNKINIINNQNKYLKQARDLLLPRLMKGEIEV